jgi:hypothetical protein
VVAELLAAGRCVVVDNTAPGPLVGMLATRARLVPPSTAEGFDRVDVVAGAGTRSGLRS